ncbi:hypothetical protein PTKIN_Ptkin05aG0062800 [Pterospermum kingtungense]
MAEQEQIKPLASVASQAGSDVDEEALSRQLNLKQRKYIQCCGCISAILLIQAVVVLVLFFTVFRIQDPMIRLNAITIQNPESLTIENFRRGVNVTLLADVSVKNPNAAAFKFHNSTTVIYYRGRVVGEGSNLQGKAKARRTLRRNVTVEIVPEKIMGVSSLESDIITYRALNISSYTRISGRVKIMNIVKKKVVVEFNCSMTYRILNGEFHGNMCRPELHF